MAEGRGEALPETVLAMLVARLSQFDAGARQALRAASVFGENFTNSGLASLLGEEPASAMLGSTLDVLVRAEVIEKQREGSASGLQRYRFRHTLVRDAAYGLLTEENRVAAHRLAGSYLERAREADAAVLAEHVVKSQERERASRFYVEATKQALASYDLDATLRYEGRAWDCGVRDSERGLLHAIQAWSVYFKLDMSAGYDHAVEALQFLKPGSYWWAKASEIASYSFFMINRFEHIGHMIREFMEATPEADACGAFLGVGHALGTFFANVGMRRQAAGLIEKLTRIASALDTDERGLLPLLNSIRICQLEPDPFLALTSAVEANALLRKQGDRHHQTLSLLYEGVCHMALGAPSCGEQVLREGQSLALRMGNTFTAAVMHLHLGFTLASQSIPAKHNEARRIGEAYRDQPQMGPAIRGAAHRILGQVLLASGDLDAAESALQSALDASSQMVPYRLWTVPLLVEVLLQQERATEARRAAEQAVQLIDEQGGLGLCEVPVRLALVLSGFAVGDAEAGRNALREALRQVEIRAEKIGDAALKQSYLNMPENLRIIELAQAHGLR